MYVFPVAQETDNRHRLTRHPAHQINGGGGVGSAAIQLARNVFNLGTVVATASRKETSDQCRRMGASHVIDHGEDLVAQIEALNLRVPIKYVGVFPRRPYFGPC